jgi:hypothetical protein
MELACAISRKHDVRDMGHTLLWDLPYDLIIQRTATGGVNG